MVTINPSIEDIILADDKRGISMLREYLDKNFCEAAAAFALAHQGNVLILTGFYILSADSHETDGPPGAIAIGNALETLGNRVTYVTDIHSHYCMSEITQRRSNILEFPIADIITSKALSSDILKFTKPDLIIAIERCGRTDSNLYLNMRGVNISDNTARLDYLLDTDIPSIGIGDGGNEIGMGNLANNIPQIISLPDKPCVTTVDHLVISSVSNWGAYGLVTAISQQTKQNLLPTVANDRSLIEMMVDLGAVDGTSGVNKYCVDNFDLDYNANILQQLHDLLSATS
ncbi:MAG: glutamate cyclase domain-containing protein [Chloroflexota bacterium]|nr:glutamate cyclase domain-containing protein [Chloroflexota bacterium]